MCNTNCAHELQVTFRPELFLQRRGWVLDIMRREGITEVLDVGCGEGELLSCLCNPAPWLAPPPPDVLPPFASSGGEDNDDATAPAEMHKDTLHPVKVAGLDVSRADLEAAVEWTQPPGPEHTSVLWHAPVRWESLEVKLWEGSLAHANAEYVGVECVVAMEVIEHLPDDVLRAFAPVVLGAYHPRVALVTTPSYTFNARFTAPNAPLGARVGWPDPTGRTARVFRHHDHKFEWTADEFARWCRAAADEWGYDLELGGVGRAQEVDEWGRDDALGWASQVAAFTRREGAEWEEVRAKRVRDLNISCTPGAQGGHKLLATHQHPAHASSGRPATLEAVGDLVVKCMAQFREESTALHELWFHNDEVPVACGGWIDWLVRAIRLHAGLSLRRESTSHEGEWTVHLDASLHHLFPAVEPSSSPDTEEIVDLWDPFDVDIAWGPDIREAVAVAIGEDDGEIEWGRPDVDADWDKGDKDIAQLEMEWGDPEGGADWSCAGE
ncbi:hypothetical protein BD413DRAFT_654272 [Trametes elegans]|nr:hypothetical protein BD413DRAFT_654272 [Trametes elegans]